ncbi:hypothetical protein ACPW7J_08400 [Ihubacter sp. rT4E-8]|uniref:hypothetical protein n=1 Tax=Ihubacter sp. rT4E-8 TaxID=3242369 RepID=UPI003CE74F1C
MYNSKLYVEKELQYQDKVAGLYRKELKDLPEGKLSVNMVKGKPYYFRLLNGKKTYLGNGDNEVVQALQKRYFLEESLKRMECNQILLDQLAKGYCEADVQDLILQAPKAYRQMPLDSFHLSETDFSGWGSSSYERNLKYPENLVHRTLKGDFVRSKSEAIISNLLFTKEIEYRYEELITIHGKSISPDFRIAVKSENRIKLLEHFGMIGNPNYLEDAMWKIKFYLENGLKPWEDVIFTFEDIHGNINTQLIDEILESFCR